MALTVDLILLVLALVCFILSTAGVASRINLQSLGLALWALSILI